MELLIIKSHHTYLRFKDSGILEVGLDKASVFPMDRLEEVRKLMRQASEKGYPKVTIKKLVLTEEDLS